MTLESLAKYLFHIVTGKEIIIIFFIFASIYSSIFPFTWAQRRELAAHSSILAGRIQWTEECGGL